MFPTPQAHCILILSIAAGQSQCFNYCILTKVFLPAVYESSQSVGCIKEKLADELELCPDTKIIIGAGDNAASAIGTGTVNDGDCNISLGTSGTIFACTEKI